MPRIIQESVAQVVDECFQGVPYVNSNIMSGSLIVAARERAKTAFGPLGEKWKLTDRLLVGETHGDLVSDRKATLARWAGGLCIFFEFTFGEDYVDISVEPPSAVVPEELDLGEEFLRGLRYLASTTN